MGDAMLIMRKRLIPGARVEEGLRLSAAMLGMDYPPLLVFADNGVEILMPEALYKNSLRDYLEVMSQMAGLYVLEESLAERGYTVDDLEPTLNVTVIGFKDLAGMAKRCSVITSY
jgi:sulfur relay (sulfurtransferase) DsrF/TusC family protein